VIAYCPCIAHGVDLCESLSHQAQSVESGHFPIYRYDPEKRVMRLGANEHPIPLAEFERSEARFGVGRGDLGDGHVHLLALSEHDARARRHALEVLEGDAE
jgi:pyruvate-ferredoxin/flavodoxin oxidoreductase